MKKSHRVATALIAVGFIPYANAGAVPSFGNLPIHFEPTASAGVFASRRAGLDLTLDEAGARLRLAQGSSTAALSLNLDGAEPRGARPERRMTGVSNYFLGKERRAWRRGVPHYERVRYEAVYPGIDLVYYGAGDALEYDFVLAAGADPAHIRMRYQGAQSMRIDSQGDLRIQVPGGELVHRRPVSYQVVDGKRREIESAFRLRDDAAGTLVTFELGDYDTRRPLTIDPVLSYATYLGGSSNNEEANAVAVDAAGALYVAGRTGSANFPVTPGTAQTAYAGAFDAFVAKLNPAGTAFEYVTYLGGSGIEEAHLLRIDAAGNAYLAGSTTSTNFPVTAGAAQTAAGGNDDVYVAKLSATGGSLLYATYLGGAENEPASAILGGFEIDANGEAFVLGDTQSTNFPTSPGAPQTTRGNPNGAQFDTDLFLTRINAAGTAFTFSSYHGGFATEVIDSSSAPGGLLSVKDATSVWIAGTTQSSNFPTTAGAFDTTFNGPVGGGDAFIARYDTAAGTRTFSTLIGGNGDELAAALDVDASNVSYLAMRTGSTDFPTTTGAFDTSYNGGNSDIALVRLDASGSTLLSSTYVGGSGTEAPTALRQFSTSDVFVAGSTQSANFPVTAGSADTSHNGGPNDGFIARVDGAGGLIYATFAGSSDTDGVGLLEIDASGSAYALLNDTAGDAFVSAGGLAHAGNADDYFVKLNPGGTAFLDATYLGGALDDFSLAMAVDAQENVYFAGTTESSNYPVTAGAPQPVKVGSAGSADISIAKFQTTPVAPPASGGTLAFANATYSFAEGVGTAVMQVTRTGGTADVTVQCLVSLAGNTATPGVDFTATTTNLSWAGSDQTSRTCSIPITNDVEVESAETFTVTLALNSAGSVIGTPSSTLVTIIDDDVAPVPMPGTVGFNPASYSASENGGSVTLTLTRTGGADGAIGVSVASGGGSAVPGSDFTALSQVVSWADGDSAPKTVALAVSNDTADEPDETVTVTLSNVTGGATLGTSSATVTITDDDPPPGPVAQDASVSGRYGKGTLDGAWLAVLVAMVALAAARRLRISRARRCALACLVLASAVGSGAQAADGGWYLGVRAGMAESTQSSGDVQRALVARGHDVTVSVDDREPSYSLLAGYRLANGFAIEGGFVELGEYDVAVSGSTTDPAALPADTMEVLADGGRGVTALLAWHIPIGTRFEFTPRLGGYYWESRRVARGGAGVSSDGDHGFDLAGGATVAWKLNERWSLGLAWECWAAGSRNDLRVWSAALTYQFGR